MEKHIEDFRDGIFSLKTRRFGTVAELMIKNIYALDMSTALNYDLCKDKINYEVKFSTVLSQNKQKITPQNIIKEILNATIERRMISFQDVLNGALFDCNIQQVKPNEFHYLIYGLFFEDQIAIFEAKTEHIQMIQNYSNKQHRGNIGEGQFHINQGTMDYHFKNHFVRWLTYEELYDIFYQI